MLEKFPWTMLPGLRIVKRLEQQNKNNKKLQCSLANWLFLAEASKKALRVLLRKILAVINLYV